VETIPEVLSRLEAIQSYTEARSPLKNQDGVASFNFLYRIITARIFDHVGTGYFPDDAFITRLDVAFANRYLDALRSHAAASGQTPRSWKALFDRRSNPGVTPLQFAVAGVNAHVNFDLAWAVVTTCTDMDRDPEEGVQRATYDRVNDVFAEEMRRLRQHFEGRLARWIDDLVLARVEDVLGNWTVEASRAQAWNLATLLWRIRHVDAAEDLALEIQDRASGLAATLLLQPIA